MAPPVPSQAVDLTATEEILVRHGRKPGALIHVLQDVQAAYRYLPHDAVERVARELGVPFTKAYGVATFYKAFSLEPRGRVVLRVCTGTACHIRGAQVLVDEAVDTLGIAPGRTTEDLSYTLETVNCVGACAMAPVVQAGDQYLGNLKPGELARYIEGEPPVSGESDEAAEEEEERA